MRRRERKKKELLGRLAFATKIRPTLLVCCCLLPGIQRQFKSQIVIYSIKMDGNE